MKRNMYLYLDVHSAMEPAYGEQIDDHQSRIVIGEGYFAEMARWEGDRKTRHFRRLAPHVDRIYYTVDEASCLAREEETLTLTNRSKIMLNVGTQRLREVFSDSEMVSSYLSESELKATIEQNDYSDPKLRDWFIRMTREIAELLKKREIPRTGERALTDEELTSVIGAARFFVREQLIEKGIPDHKATPFCKKDSYLLRRHICVLSRFYDWALRNGVERMTERDMYAERADLRHVCLASYFDRFLTKESANQRSDRNLRRAVFLARFTKELAIPSRPKPSRL